MSNASPCVVIEALEGRRLLSASLASAAALPEHVLPAVKAAILGPSAVEGNYKGDAVANGSTVEEIKLKITSTSIELFIVGYGDGTVHISAATLKKLREGTFKLSLTVKQLSVSLSGTVTKAGERISGDFSVSGKATATGTFSLKKY
jgi:hypothetical protein